MKGYAASIIMLFARLFWPVTSKPEFLQRPAQPSSADASEPKKWLGERIQKSHDTCKCK